MNGNGAKSVVTYVESLYEGSSMNDAINRILECRKTGSLTVNFVCGGVASVKWTEKEPRKSLTKDLGTSI